MGPTCLNMGGEKGMQLGLGAAKHCRPSPQHWELCISWKCRSADGKMCEEYSWGCLQCRVYSGNPDVGRYMESAF